MITALELNQVAVEYYYEQWNRFVLRFNDWLEGNTEVLKENTRKNNRELFLLPEFSAKLNDNFQYVKYLEQHLAQFGYKLYVKYSHSRNYESCEPMWYIYW